MYRTKIIPVLILGLTMSLLLITGCATQKVVEKKQAPVEKVVVEQKPAPVVPEKKPAPQPMVTEAPKKVEKAVEKPAVPADLKFGSIFFDFDTSVIRSDQQSMLRNNAQLLSLYKTVTILITGNCDERGTNEYNVALGQKRADVVRNYLIDYGIDRSRISTVSHGEEQAMDKNHNETAWAKNRRSEFSIIALK